MTTMRIATAQSEGCGTSNVGNVHRPVKVIVAPELLDRLDITIASGDSYGCSKPDYPKYGKYFKNRKGLSGAVSHFDNGGYSTHMGNTEAVIRRGVPPQMIKRVCCKNESDRKAILGHCEQAGITEHLGCPIEDFVVVEENQGSIYNKYLKPLGY